MKIYQLHLKGKNRAHHNFKTAEEALDHQKRLIRYSKDRISEGQLGYRKYLDEARNLKVAEIEVKVRTNTFTVCEYGANCSGVIKHFPEFQYAEDFLNKISENSNRHYDIMRSVQND